MILVPVDTFCPYEFEKSLGLAKKKSSTRYAWHLLILTPHDGDTIRVAVPIRQPADRLSLVQRERVPCGWGRKSGTLHVVELHWSVGDFGPERRCVQAQAHQMRSTIHSMAEHWLLKL